MTTARVHVRWDDSEQSIIIYNFEAGWDWDDFYRARAEATTMMNSVPHLVSVIAYQHYAGAYLAPNVLSHLKSMVKSRHPRLELTVIVLSSPFTRQIFTLFLKLSPEASRWYRFVDTLDQARAVITTHRALLSAVE